MGIASSSSLKGAVLTLSVLALLPSSSQARGLLFSSAVTARQAGQLNADLGNDLSQPADRKVQVIMGINSLSDSALKSWLSDRVGYIIGQNEKDEANLVAVQRYKYPNNIFPDFESPNPNGPGDDSSSGGSKGTKGSGKVVTVMSNVGTSYYYIGKSKSVIAGYKFTNSQGTHVIPVVSPRVGILKVGDGLFMLPYKENPNSMVNTWFRLITLFHEAHHSDGNGKSLGFPHAVCPEGTVYYNYNACDREINGAYGVELFLLNHVRQTCMANQTCNAKEAEILGQMVTDTASRLLAKNFLDSKPEIVEVGGNL